MDNKDLITPALTKKEEEEEVDNLQDNYVHVGRCEEVSAEYGRTILRLHETSKPKNLLESHVHRDKCKQFVHINSTAISLQKRQISIPAWSRLMAMLRKSLISGDLKASI